MIDFQKKMRRAQTIQPFGVGSIVDIDGESFVVNDISKWKRPSQIVELERINKILGYQKELRSFSSCCLKISPLDNHEKTTSRT